MDSKKCSMIIEKIRMQLDMLEESMGEDESMSEDMGDEESPEEDMAPEEEGEAPAQNKGRKLAALILLAKKKMRG